MQCRKCGEDIAPDARQCWHCGTYTPTSRAIQFEHYVLIAFTLVVIGTAVAIVVWLGR